MSPSSSVTAKLLRVFPALFACAVILGSLGSVAGTRTTEDSAPPVDSALQIQELKDKLTKDPSDAEAHTQLGILFMKEKLYEDARASFISALQAAPAEPSSHLNLGVALLQMERFAEAKAPLTTFVSMTPDQARGYALLGQVEAMAGELAPARETWLKGVDSTGPMSASDRLVLLDEIRNSYLEDDRTPSTKELIELAAVLEAHDELLVGKDAASLRGTIDFAYQEVAKLAHEEGKDDEALAAYSHMRARGSHNRAAWTEPVEILLERKDSATARLIIDEARESRPNDAVVDYLAGRVSREEGDLSSAAADFRRTIEKDSEFPGAYAALGEALAGLGDHQGASRALAKAIERGEGGAAAAYNMGVVLSQNKKYAEAIAHLREAIELDANRPDAYRALGIAYRKTNQFSKSAEAYQSLVDRFGPNPVDLYQLAFAQAKKGDHRKAVSNYSVVTAMQSNNRLAHYNLGNSLLKLERFEEAADSFGRALELQAGFHSASYNLALCFQKMGDYEKAIAQYELTLEIKESYASLVNLAICYKEMGDEDTSNDYYKMANELKNGGR
jgi:tetratricopeptide (TPR) repeat protein